MDFLDKWKWLNFQEVRDQRVQGLTSENEKLTLTHILQKFYFFFKYLNTEVEQPIVHCDTSN